MTRKSFRRRPAAFRRRRLPLRGARPLVAFLLVACFGILFAGCARTVTIKGPEAQEEEFTFTEEDIAQFRELTSEEEGESTGTGLALRLDLREVESVEKPPVLDLSLVETYESIRSGPAAVGPNLYRVTNEFVNVRESPTITAPLVMRLDRGALVTLVEFINAAWAKVEYAAGKQGYIVSRYIAKLATEEKLTADKEQFKGLYFVNFGFVNVRKEPNAQSEKLGELPGQSFVRPLSMDEVWARIPFQGKEGYVAVQYLSPFLPNFLVRQEKYMLPILHYTLADDTQLPALRAHVARLRAEGFKILTLRAFYDLLLAQEQRDVRLDPKSVVLVISGITPGNARAVSEGLLADTIRATLFIETRHIGLSGITEKMLLTLIANGHDLESAGHTGDDLRSLTNAQLELELKQSRKILEDLTGKTVFAIAYPQGGVNERVMQKASEAGYLLGLSNVPERTVTRAQFLRLPSFTISFGLTADDIVKIARGT